MATKKTSESFTTKTAGELVVGDLFRPVASPPWQEVILLNKTESEHIDTGLQLKREVIFCRTKVDGSIEEFPFSSFSDIEVEVLNG